MMIAPISPSQFASPEPIARASQMSKEDTDGFMSALAMAGQNAIRSINGAEVQSLSAIAGQGSTREVVEAIMSAEQTLHVAAGIRDKIVSAYLELSRMAI